MSHPARFRVAGASAASAAVLATLWASPYAQAARTAPSGVPEAVDFLVGGLVDGDHVENSGFTDYGQTLDVGYGLAAAGGADDTLDAIAAFSSTPEAVDAYTHGAPFDAPGAVYAGPTGKLGLFAALNGLDPREIGGLDLVEQLSGIEQPSGRFTDVGSDFGENSSVFSQSFGVLFLTAAEEVEPSTAAVQFLIDGQCDDGGFPIRFTEPATCESSPDATGLAIQALNADDPDEGADTLPPAQEDAVVAAVRWLESSRAGDGSWNAFDAPNVNATGYAAMGLLGVGQTAELSIDWLLGLQLPDGGLPIEPGGDSNVYATAQALPSLASTAFVTLSPDVLAPMIGVPAVEPTQSPTPSASPTPSTSPTATPTVSLTPTSAYPTGTGTPHPTLPATGGGSATVSLVGFGLLLAGAGAILAARRLADRP